MTCFFKLSFLNSLLASVKKFLYISFISFSPLVSLDLALFSFSLHSPLPYRSLFSFFLGPRDDQSEHLTNHDHSRQSPANQQHYALKSPKKSPTMVGLPPWTFHQPNCIIGNLAKVFPAFAPSFFLILETYNDKDYGVKRTCGVQKLLFWGLMLVLSSATERLEILLKNVSLRNYTLWILILCRTWWQVKELFWSKTFLVLREFDGRERERGGGGERGSEEVKNYRKTSKELEKLILKKQVKFYLCQVILLKKQNTINSWFLRKVLLFDLVTL